VVLNEKKITKTRSKENVLTNPKKNNVDEKRLNVLKTYSRNTFFNPRTKDDILEIVCFRVIKQLKLKLAF